MLRARGHHDQLAKCVKRIYGGIDALESILNEEKGSRDWKSWQSDFRIFKNDVKEFETVASVYMDFKGSLLDVDPEAYKASASKWTFSEDEFEKSDYCHDFKTFRLIRTDFVKIEQNVMRAIDEKSVV